MQIAGLDAGGELAPPQAYVEVGMRAAEELDDLQAAQGAAAERPEKEWCPPALNSTTIKGVRPDAWGRSASTFMAGGGQVG